MSKSNQVSKFQSSSLSSITRLKETKVLTFCGMMGARALILSYVATIKIGQFIRIGFSGLPGQIVDFLFVPWFGSIFAGTMDIVKWFVNGDGEFFPGFTVTAIVAAIIYGLFLYNKPVKISNVVFSQLLVKLFCNIGLNTLWLKMLYNQAVLAILPGRIISNAVMLPIDCFIMYAMLKAVGKIIRPYYQNY